MLSLQQAFNHHRSDAQQMNAYADTPFFLPPHKEESSGVDYLGMRATNLQMMDDLLPGLNNVARHIRPFSLMSWMIWQYERQQKQRGKKLSSIGFKKYREKIECLYLFSHHLAGLPTGGIAGAGQPSNLGATVTLQFGYFKRSAATTLFAATAYGP